MLLSDSGPSTVAVRFGASRTSKESDNVDGLRWKSDTAIGGSNCSDHPSNHNSAEISPSVSVSSSSRLIDQAPDVVTMPDILLEPLTLEVNDK